MAKQIHFIINPVACFVHPSVPQNSLCCGCASS